MHFLGLERRDTLQGTLQLGPSHNNEKLLQAAPGVKTELLVDIVPFSQDVLKHFYMSTKLKYKLNSQIVNSNLKFH